jgi:hypothetical protein
VRLVLEPAVALPVTGDIDREVVADRKRGRPEEGAAVVVTHVDDLARPVADRIVGPGGDLVLATVDRPGAASALGRHLEAERRVGDDIDPWRRRPLPGAQDGDILPALLGEAAEPVEELKRRARRRSLRRSPPRGKARRRRGRGPGGLQTVQLLRERALSADQNRPGGGLEQGPGLHRDLMGAQDEDGAARPAFPDVRPRLAHADHGFQANLKILRIGGRPLVQDDEVDRQLLQPPIFVRPQHLTDDVGLLGVVDLHQDDRQIAGNAMGPERRRSAATAPKYRR